MNRKLPDDSTQNFLTELPSEQAKGLSAKQSGKQNAVITILLLLVVAVVFLLPNFVSDPWIEDWSEDTQSSAPGSPSTVSPSVAAEKTKYRHDSQSLLAQIITVRDRLTDSQVQLWGEFEFKLALEKISEGDEYYSTGDYQQSLDRYQASLDLLKALETKGKETFNQAIAEGIEAIEQGNLAVAQTASELASAITPDDSQAQQLLQRASVLPKVIEQLNLGDQYFNQQQFSSAEQAYQQALSLDPSHQRANEGQQNAHRSALEQRFRRHMSDGFNATEINRFSEAAQHFDRAAEIYPQHQAVAQAREQLNNRQSLYQVGQQIRRAQKHEESEEWQEAVSIYQTLLKTDPTLTDAKVRQIPAQVRAELDSRINKILDNPLSLSAGATYQQAKAILNDAKGISNPGEKLTYQIVRLEKLLKLSVVPVNVQFQSDSLTEVTLFKVAKLGQFQQKTVMLKPGKYIVAGSRKGYRDVRIEFTVTGEPLAPIFVSCKEPI